MKKLLLLLAISLQLAVGQQKIFSALLNQKPACSWHFSTGLKGLWIGGATMTCTGGCTGTNPIVSWATTSPSPANTLTAGSAAAYDATGINGIPAANFNGSTNYYTLANPIAAGDTSVFAGIKQNSTAAEGTITGSSTASGELAYWLSLGGKLQGADVAGIVSGGSGTTAQNTNWNQINIAALSGVSATFRINRTSDGSSTMWAGTSFSDSINAIGQNFGNAFLNSRIAVLAIYSGAVTGTNNTTVENDINCLTGL